jgi:hypothetical protein
MKIIKILLAFLAWVALPADSKDWTPYEKQLLAADLVLHVCDWAQTREIARDQVRYYEGNALLGESPSKSRVDNYFIGSALLTAAASHLLPRYRRLILTGVLVIEASVVAHNQSIGVAIKF